MTTTSQTNVDGTAQDKPFPLDGVRVVDFSHVLSGPFCTMLLADLGAEVIKIERPGAGDENRRMRTYKGRGESDEDYFYPMNRNKKSVTLNLKDPRDRGRVLVLIEGADVVVENFTPGTMAKLGLGYESLSAINPGLIYCSISGYGQTGPYRDRKAYDFIVQAVTGVMSITGERDGPPLRAGLMFGDLSGALYALSSILVSLYAREKTGRGNYIDLAMADALLSLFSTNAAEYLAVGRAPQRWGSENPGRSPTGSYLCADGKYIQVMGGSDRIWSGFCRATGLEDLIEDEHFATNELRIANRDALRAVLEPVFLTRSAEEWVERLSGHGCPVAPINRLDEVMEDAHFRHRQMELPLEHPASGSIRTINNPFRFSAWSSWRDAPPPLLGQHNDDY